MPPLLSRKHAHIFIPYIANASGNLYALKLMQDFSPQLLVVGFVWYVAFLFSTTCHEAAHALVAKIGGDDTAAQGGQVSLNPIPHIRRSPFGMVVIPIVSFALGGWMIGWANAPYDPNWQRQYPRRSAWMALAGVKAPRFTRIARQLEGGAGEAALTTMLLSK